MCQQPNVVKESSSQGTSNFCNLEVPKIDCFVLEESEIENGKEKSEKLNTTVSVNSSFGNSKICLETGKENLENGNQKMEILSFGNLRETEIVSINSSTEIDLDVVSINSSPEPVAENLQDMITDMLQTIDFAQPPRILRRLHHPRPAKLPKKVRVHANMSFVWRLVAAEDKKSTGVMMPDSWEPNQDMIRAMNRTGITLYDYATVNKDWMEASLQPLIERTRNVISMAGAYTWDEMHFWTYANFCKEDIILMQHCDWQLNLAQNYDIVRKTPLLLKYRRWLYSMRVHHGCTLNHKDQLDWTGYGQETDPEKDYTQFGAPKK